MLKIANNVGAITVFFEYRHVRFHPEYGPLQYQHIIMQVKEIFRLLIFTRYLLATHTFDEMPRMLIDLF
jgi:hypothetical protein